MNDLSDKDILEFLEQKRREIKPSRDAQHYRADIAFKLDSGKYPYAESELMPDIIWDVLDIAFEILIQEGKLKKYYEK